MLDTNQLINWQVRAHAQSMVCIQPVISPSLWFLFSYWFIELNKDEQGKKNHKEENNINIQSSKN